MHPFGGTPICPRCSKAVYAAEQVMGPGRKLYHKPCLACTECNKRLDSLSLLEHDEQPYCKNCHVKCFGTRDLRQANLPYRPLSPTRTGTTFSPPASPTRATPPPRLFPVGRANTGGAFSGMGSPGPLLRPTRALSPTRATFGTVRANVTGSGGGFSPSPTRQSFEALSQVDEDAAEPEADPLRPATPERERGVMTGTGTPTHVGRGLGGLPRTVPLTPDHSPTRRAADEDWAPKTQRTDAVADEEEDEWAPKRVTPLQPPPRMPATVGRAAPSLPPRAPATVGRSASNGSVSGDGSVPPLPPRTPATMGRSTSGGDGRGGVMTLNLSTGGGATMGRLATTPTGTRYGAGAALRTTPTGGGKVWGSGTPQCPRCGKSVYFAEQVKAVGKTWHKSCLRCTECGTSLDSTRLTEKDGAPFCHRCYSKLHGPQGSGYALLGKAGG